MKNSTIHRLLCLMIFGVLLGCNSSNQSEIDGLNQQVAKLDHLFGPLPASLDNFYPPRAEAPVYFLRMLDLNNSIAGTMVDVLSNDMENARTNFGRFKANYNEMSQMVPEWTSLFPAEPLSELENALASGDPGKIMPAFEGVGAVCEACHVSQMSKTYIKYHWPDFESFQFPDPFGKGDIGYHQLMMYLNLGLVGIGNELAQGQNDKAIEQFNGFNTSFQALKGTCGLCHETDRTYFVDQKIQSLIDNLGQVVASPEVDMQKVMELSHAIGEESCGKCHMVHMTSFTTKLNWKQIEGIVAR